MADSTPATPPEPRKSSATPPEPGTPADADQAPGTPVPPPQPPAPTAPPAPPAGPPPGPPTGPASPARLPAFPAPPRPPSLLKRRWPGPGRHAGTAVWLATVAAGAAVAATLPLERPGVGWLLCGAAATVPLAIAAVPARPVSRSDGTGVPERARIGLDRLFWAAMTLALLAVGMLRAAGWLFVLCLLTAGVTASLAVSGGRSVRSLLLGLAIPPVAAVRAVPWAARGVARSGRGRPVGRIIATAAVTVGLLVVFGALFASADAAFADLVDHLLPEVGAPTVFRALFLFPPAAVALAGGAFLLTAPPDLSGLESRAARHVGRWEWMVPVALLDLLFAAFVLVQITVLFGGAAHVLDASGPTFAQHARSGFWQLLLVTALTLPVLGAAARWAPRDRRADRASIRALLGTLALLTLVVVASALYRMHVYQQAYGFTRLRLLVSACELWLGLVFVLVLVAGVRLHAAWLPRVVVASAVLALLGLAALNPDRFIADRNVDRFEATSRVDISYLSELSADALPALNRLPAPHRHCALISLSADLREDPDGWRGWNLARARARDLLDAEPVGSCPGNFSYTR